jgi:hypothetical protein
VAQSIPAKPGICNEAGATIPIWHFVLQEVNNALGLHWATKGIFPRLFSTVEVESLSNFIVALFCFACPAPLAAATRAQSPTPPPPNQLWRAFTTFLQTSQMMNSP